MRINFRLLWFRIEILPKPQIVLDVRRNIGCNGCLLPFIFIFVLLLLSVGLILDLPFLEPVSQKIQPVVEKVKSIWESLVNDSEKE